MQRVYTIIRGGHRLRRSQSGLADRLRMPVPHAVLIVAAMLGDTISKEILFEKNSEIISFVKGKVTVLFLPREMWICAPQVLFV